MCVRAGVGLKWTSEVVVVFTDQIFNPRFARCFFLIHRPLLLRGKNKGNQNDWITSYKPIFQNQYYTLINHLFGTTRLSR